MRLKDPRQLTNAMDRPQRLVFQKRLFAEDAWAVKTQALLRQANVNGLAIFGALLVLLVFV